MLKSRLNLKNQALAKPNHLSNGVKYSSRKTARSAATLISLLLVLGALMPATARAGVLGDIVSAILHAPEKQKEISSGSGNLQTMVLPKPAMNVDPMVGKGGGDITIVDDSALMPAEGPSGTPTEYDRPKNSTISLYTVVEGDTLSVIAKLFKVSPDTVLWANDLPRNAVLKVGQTLVILPVTGVRYTVKPGDTLASIAKKFGADAVDIGNFNGIDGSMVVAGTKLIIPDGEIAVAAVVAAPASSKPAKGILATTLNSRPGTAAQKGYYIRPLAGGVKTQGVHGYNGVDLAAPIGTPILAAAEGDVLIAKETGWNAGYGGYVVIRHANGSQTLYAHQSGVAVSPGQHVQQGQVIGYVGSTGKSTGAHVHFEIRNGIRNPF
ncbi:MAG: M23 family metallopeptidase [bacterium]|nr:M23 family metallopeptidase [bacterium]